MDLRNPLVLVLAAVVAYGAAAYGGYVPGPSDLLGRVSSIVKVPSFFGGGSCESQVRALYARVQRRGTRATDEELAQLDKACPEFRDSQAEEKQ